MGTPPTPTSVAGEKLELFLGLWCLIFRTPPAAAEFVEDAIPAAPDPFPIISIAARSFAAFCCASRRGSSSCERSHQTVAFCLRINATYPPAELPPDLDDVDLRIDTETVALGRPTVIPPLVAVVEVEVVAFDSVRRVVL